MRHFLSSKVGLPGLTIAFVMLASLAFLAGTISNNHNAALAQAVTLGQATTPAATQSATLSSPTATTPAQTEASEGTTETETTEGNEVPETAGKGPETDNQAALQAQAKFTVEQVKVTALAKVSGTVLSVKLEDENGKAVYNVVVTPTAGGTNQEIKVDATNNQVLKVETADEQKDGTDNQD